MLAFKHFNEDSTVFIEMMSPRGIRRSHDCSFLPLGFGFQLYIYLFKYRHKIILQTIAVG